MNLTDPLFLGAAGLVACLLLYVMFPDIFGRQEKRRRRNHHRLIAKANRPIVKFSVRTR